MNITATIDGMRRFPFSHRWFFKKPLVILLSVFLIFIKLNDEWRNKENWMCNLNYKKKKMNQMN